jgi:chromate transporter
MQLLVIAGGAALGAAWLRPGGTDAAPAPAAVTATAESLRTTRWPLIALVASLALLPLLTLLSNHPAVTLAERCQRAGALVFGGGHVVLPLLERAFVTPAGVTPDQFLAGYGAAQALPGPLFAFAAYLGAVQHGALGGVWALGWIFLPGLLLVPAVWPAWRTLRSFRSAQGALRGANATVVGLLLAALISPVARPALADASSAALAIGAFAALQFTRVPAWAVVLASAALGFALH